MGMCGPANASDRIHANFYAGHAMYPQVWVIVAYNLLFEHLISVQYLYSRCLVKLKRRVVLTLRTMMPPARP